MKLHEDKTAAFALAVLLLLGLSHSRTVEAQTNTGTISGVVSDAAGAGIPDAQITATNTENGTTTQTTSQENGEYRLASLLPGIYRISVEKSGFKVSTSDNVQLVFGGRWSWMCRSQLEMSPSQSRCKARRLRSTPNKQK